jgi:ribosomal protein S4
VSSFQDILDEPDEVETDAPVAEATAEAPAPETPEAPAPESVVAEAEPVIEATAPVTREDGATWSEKAQRWYKDGKIVSGEAPAKVEQAPEAVTPVVAEAPKAPEAPAPVVAEPFPIRVNGQRILVPGITVAPEHQDAVRALLVDAYNHRQNFPRMQAEHKQALAQAEAKGKAEAETWFSLMSRTYKILTDPEAVAALAQDPREIQFLKRELQLAFDAAQLRSQSLSPASEPAEEVDLEPAARATLAGYVKELFEDNAEASRYFTPEDRQAFERDVQELVEAFFVERDGEIMLNEVKVEAQFKRQLGLLQRAHQARETAARDAEKQKAAAAFNAAQKPVVATPPTPPRPKPALAAAPSGAKPKGWDQVVKDIWNDDDEE